MENGKRSGIVMLVSLVSTIPQHGDRTGARLSFHDFVVNRAASSSTFILEAAVLDAHGRLEGGDQAAQALGMDEVLPVVVAEEHARLAVLCFHAAHGDGTAVREVGVEFESVLAGVEVDTAQLDGKLGRAVSAVVSRADAALACDAELFLVGAIWDGTKAFFVADATARRRRTEGRGGVGGLGFI